jgi:hypothetical protein
VGCLFTFAFYVFFRSSQGHGWGDRYFYPAMGNLVLLAVGGWYILARSLPPRPASAFLTVGVIGAILLQVPYRLYEVHRTVAPYARGWRFIRSQPQPIVVLEDPWAVPYGIDFIRNDPLMRQGPVIVNGATATRNLHIDRAELLRRLQALGPVREITADELRAATGL